MKRQKNSVDHGEKPKGNMDSDGAMNGGEKPHNICISVVSPTKEVINRFFSELEYRNFLSKKVPDTAMVAFSKSKRCKMASRKS